MNPDVVCAMNLRGEHFFQGSYFIHISYKIVFFILIFQLWVDVIKNFEMYSYNVRIFTGNCFNNSIFVNRETPTIYLTQVLESQNYSVKSNWATVSFQTFMTFTLLWLSYFGQFSAIWWYLFSHSDSSDVHIEVNVSLTKVKQQGQTGYLNYSVIYLTFT